MSMVPGKSNSSALNIFFPSSPNLLSFVYSFLPKRHNNHVRVILHRRGFEGAFMYGFSSVDVTQSEGDMPDFNQSEH